MAQIWCLLWLRPVAAALIQPLAYFPFAAGTAIKKKKKKKKRKIKKKKKKKKKKRKIKKKKKKIMAVLQNILLWGIFQVSFKK